MDHGGHDPRAIGFNVDHFIPQILRVNPLDRLADISADYLITFVHLLSLLSLDGYILAWIRKNVNYFLKKFFFKKVLKSVDNLSGVCYNVVTEREGMVRTMSEKMDMILYMMENGYKGDLEGLTLEEIRKVAVEFFGEDPTA